MMDTECIVLYTHQKLKKAKTWHDGVLKILSPGTRAILYDDKKTKIDTVHIRPEAIVCGEQLESDRHLILIEEIKSGVSHDQVPVSDGQGGGHVVQSRQHLPNTSVGGRLSIRAGIKRRKTGFVPPRMVKQPRLDEDQTDVCDIGFNNRTVSSSPPSYENRIKSNLDTDSILNLYSRTGAGKTHGSLSTSFQQSRESTNTPSLQSSSEPLCATPTDQRSSPSVRHACNESPGTVSQVPSPWASFGAGRLKSLGGDPFRNTGGGTNEQFLNDGTRSSFHQNNSSRTTNVIKRNMLLSEKDQRSCNKNVSESVSKACGGSQRTFLQFPVRNTSSGHNTATKRSASQIMALLGKSRNKDLIQAGDERQSESQCTETSQDSSVLPVSQDGKTLPVSQGGEILPVSQGGEILPVSQGGEILPVSQGGKILPTTLPPQLPCNIDRTGHHGPNDCGTAVKSIGLSGSGTEISWYDNQRFGDSQNDMQHQTIVRASCQKEMPDFLSDFDISLTSSEVTDKVSGPTEATPVGVEAYTELYQCSTDRDTSISEKEADLVYGMDRGRISQEHIHVQDINDKDNTSNNLNDQDISTPENSKIVSLPASCKVITPDVCSNEVMGDKCTDNDLAAMYGCDKKERPGSPLSDDDDDNIDLGQQASFLISYSPLSQVSCSDDDEDVLNSSHKTDQKQETMENKGGRAKEDHILVVEREVKQIDKTENSVKISSAEASIQLSELREGDSFHNSDMDKKQITLEDGQTKEEQLIDKKDEWSNKTENISEISSEESNMKVTDLSESNYEMWDCQTSENESASQVPQTGECSSDSNVLVDQNVSMEQFRGLNDLNFSPDSVAFSSLPSIEGREEKSKLNVNSWHIKETFPDRNLETSSPNFAVMSPKSTSSRYSVNQAMEIHPEIGPDSSNITPQSNGKHFLQCNNGSEQIKIETPSPECTLGDVCGSGMGVFGKSYSLPSSRELSTQDKEVSMFLGSKESRNQTDSTKFGRDTPPIGFVNNKCMDTESPSIVYHSSESSWSMIQPATGMSNHCDTIPVRTTQEQHSFVESMRSQCRRPAAVMENYTMSEEHLPHPSQLLRRPSVTANTVSTIPPIGEEDPFTDRVDPGPIENATQQLQQYRVRGSISGEVARRTSKSASGQDYHHTPTLPVTRELTAKEILFSSMSPNQTLENTSFPPDQDDRSLFIDWNVGKPQLVDMTTLCNLQDIKVPGSPYQHVPVDSESPQSYDGGGEDSGISKVPDIDFGRTKNHDLPVYPSQYSSAKSSQSVLTPDCGSQNVPAESVRLPLEVESPTYGNMFKEKRNMISESEDKINKFCDKLVVVKKEKVSLKCKPFQDSFTHTSYSSSYFSPAGVKDHKDIPVSVDFTEQDITTDVDTQGRKYTPSCVGTIGQKDIPTRVDIRGQREVPTGVDNRGRTDNTKRVKHLYSNSPSDILGEMNDSNHNKEQSINDGCPLDRKGDLNLSLSSLGSSDLELSFTLTEHYQGQSKPSDDLPGNNQMYVSSNTETDHLRSSVITVSDLKSSRTYEDNPISSVNEYNNSKWGKFIMKEDQDDNLIFDDSFDEENNFRNWGNRMYSKSVNESRCMISGNSNQLQGNKSNSIIYNKFTIDTNNSFSSQNLPLSNQKPSSGIKKHTMSPCFTKPMLVPVRPHTGSRDVSPNMDEKENEFSQELLMDDFDMPETEDMTLSSSFSKQDITKPELHMVPPSVSSASMTPVAESDVIPLRSRSMVFTNTSTALTQNEIFVPRKTTMNKSPSLPLTPVAECGILSQRQNNRKKFNSLLPSAGLVTHVMKGSKRNISVELQFASKEEVDSNPVPLREVSISVNFPTVVVYKQVLTAAIKEHLNIILFEQAQQFHHALGMVDISDYSPAQHQGPLVNKSVSMNKASTNPHCQCGVPSKMIQVKKAGNNKGRFFYTCNSPRNKQCKYFQWVDQTGGGQTSISGGNKLKLCEASSINTYMRGNHIMFYCECELLRKTVSDITSHFKKGVPNWVKMKYEKTNQDKKKLFVKLSKKDAGSLYSKDDLWIISTTLNFHPSQTFLAKSAYFGPNSACEVEIEPVAGFSPSNWPNHAFCHALLVGNISSELCYLSNIEDNMNPTSLPILPWILDSPKTGERELSQPGGFKAPVRTTVSKSNIFATKTSIMELAEEFIQSYKLNTDQSSALMRVCHMFCKSENGPDLDPVLLIHGVFGAGKSFLLSVIVLFLVRLFEVSDTYTPGVPYPWKVLISSTTNVAVDRILLGLLEIGFEDFVRVGSMKKISKPVLPFSVHATGSESQELKDLQEMLRSGELTPSEKRNVRQSIEKHRLGENKKRLSKVRVVGVTCASCTASSLEKMTFPVVLLDESSQMTEPASLLPIAKFGCEKLLLVGDPKQLDPTIQGSEAAHSNGLEQTLFDRLMKMGHTPTVLHTQYRCHPVISNLANTLFYGGQLIDGITTADREQLVPEIPTLCFYDVSSGQEQADDGGSFYNEKEAVFVTSLIQELLERGVEPASIGVITLYKSQMYKINTSLLTNVRSDSNKEIKAARVSTVDAFQGGEHDIIILSCVRTKGIGFIDNHKRTNVALTRARHHLLIVGKKSNLSQNQLWGQVLQLCDSQPGGVCEADTFLQQLVKTDQVKSKDNTSGTPCSPPMDLSTQETCNDACSQHDEDNAVTEPESPPLTPPAATVVPVRRKCRVINADLLDCSEPSDSDEDLPIF